MSNVNMKEIGGECMYCTCRPMIQYIECQHKIYQTLPLAFEPTNSQSWSKQITTAQTG